MSQELILTPECQTLWILSPSILFLYDEIIIDKQDYESLLHPKNSTKLSLMKAVNLERLNKWGLIKTVSYSDIIDSETKQNIHDHAEKIVNNLILDSNKNLEYSRFIDLTIFGHKEYLIYLQNCFKSCPIEDQETLYNYMIRCEKINNRIKSLETKKFTDDLLNNVAFSSKRATAKILAGMVIANRLNKSKLFDTKEYIPRIKDIKKDNPSLTKVNYIYDEDHKPYNIIIAALSDKNVPEIDFYDKWRLFAELKEKKEFIFLKECIDRISSFFNYFINENPNIAYEKIKSEIKRIEEEYIATVKKINRRFIRKFSWRSIEMLVSQTIGFLSPLLEDVKNIDEKIISNKVKSMFLSERNLKSDLFFIGEQWRKYDLSKDKKFHITKKKCKTITNNLDTPLWGEDKTFLPWYESK